MKKTWYYHGKYSEKCGITMVNIQKNVVLPWEMFKIYILPSWNIIQWAMF